MRKRAYPSPGAFRDAEIDFGGTDPISFYREYCRQHAEARETGPTTPPTDHTCNRECDMWSRGDTFLCRHSGNIHQCSASRACSFAESTPERHVCPITGYTSPLELDFECSLFTSHHGRDAKRVRAAFATGERSEHDAQDKEQRLLMADSNTLRLVYEHICDALLGGMRPPGVWKVGLRLWRLLADSTPARGQPRDECANEHILTLLHMMSSDFVLYPSKHAVWRGDAALAQKLPARRHWAKMGIPTRSRKVTRREIIVRQAITDYHRRENDCSPEQCSLSI